MTDRRLELIEAERLRHIAVSKLDTGRRAEHEEVAAALAWALGRLRREDKPCRSARSIRLCPLPLGQSLSANPGQANSCVSHGGRPDELSTSTGRTVTLPSG